MHAVLTNRERHNLYTQYDRLNGCAQFQTMFEPTMSGAQKLGLRKTARFLAMIKNMHYGVQVVMVMDAKMLMIANDHKNNLHAFLYNLGVTGRRHKYKTHD